MNGPYERPMLLDGEVIRAFSRGEALAIMRWPRGWLARLSYGGETIATFFGRDALAVEDTARAWRNAAKLNRRAELPRDLGAPRP